MLWNSRGERCSSGRGREAFAGDARGSVLQGLIMREGDGRRQHAAVSHQTNPYERPCALTPVTSRQRRKMAKQSLCHLS